MNREIPKLVLDFQLESNSGASRRRVTHLVHDPSLPPFADPTAETWESARRAIGRGGQGEVLLQTCTSNGPRLNNVRALKVVRCLDGDERRRQIRELETMVRFSHERYSKSFVRMLGWYISKGKGDLCIAMEYLRHGDLHSFIQNRPPLDEPDAKHVMSQVLHGLGHMHKAGFAHMDVKPQNILIYQHPSSDESSSWWIKLSDFGISKNLEASVSVVGIGTRDYMAPELFNPSAKASEMDLRLADMWSVGVTAFYLLTKEKGFREWRSSFGSFGGQESLNDVPGMMGSQRRPVSADALAFVLETTNEALTERLRWMDALGHAWTRRYRQASSGLPAEEEEDHDEGSSIASWSSSSSLGAPTENFGRGLTTIETALSQTILQESRPITAALAAGSGNAQSPPLDDADPRIGGRKEMVASDDDTVVQAYESATGIKVDLSDLNSEVKETGQKQLFAAASEGHLDMVKLLMRKGAVADQASGGKSALRAAAERGYVEVVSFLAGWGASVSMPGPDRLSPLMAAANRGHADVVRLLVNLGAEVEAQDPKGRTALSHAVLGDSLEAAEALLQMGAKVNTANDMGEAPLYLATMQSNPEMMEMLLLAGADVDTQNEYGLAPIFLAGCGMSDERIKLLVRYGVNLSVHTAIGSTPLHAAAGNGSVEMVRALVELGCDPCATDNSGSTVLDVARAESRQDIAEYLEQKVAERNAK